MKSSLSIPWLPLAMVLLCGCGGGKSSPSSPSPAAPPPQTPNVAGNWELTSTSLAGMPNVTFGGSLNQSANSLSGALHIDGSNCFDRATTIQLTGTLTGSNFSLTSAPLAGQVVTLTGQIDDTSVAGAYSTKGGCADGDHGNVTGSKIPLITGHLSGTFTPSGGGTFDLEADLTPGTASPEGSFGLAGAAAFSASCFSSGTITPGTFPSGSFMIGRSVALEIKTDSGTVSFLGTEKQGTSHISGRYTVSDGGTCDQTGTATLFGDPWGY